MEPVDHTPAELAPDPEREPSRRERLAAVVEDRLDPFMAALALVWGGLVAYELVAPADQLDELRLVGNVIWGVFLVEFVTKLVISGKPIRFLRRRWLSVFFLVLPALRLLRVLRALRALRLLPAARVVGSGYRTIGTARSLLGGRLSFLGVATVAVVFAGGQLLFLLEAGGRGGGERLAETLWWSANLAISGSFLFEPETAAGRLVSLFLSGYAVVVFASLAATIGAFFIEQRSEQMAAGS